MQFSSPTRRNNIPVFVSASMFTVKLWNVVSCPSHIFTFISDSCPDQIGGVINTKVSDLLDASEDKTKE